jgi:16S rRNA (guanine966-N2)-methyltransferase
VRIVGGRFRGAALATPADRATRPTSDRLRESLFNILAHADGDPATDARVIDRFAGTGALGLEAMSRGAVYCLFVEDAGPARALIRRNIETLSLTGTTRLFRRDATKLGPCAPVDPFDLAFLDPPYGKGLGDKALSALVGGGWLKDGALAVLEEDAAAEVTIPPAFTVEERRTQGDTALTFLRYSAAG